MHCRYQGKPLTRKALEYMVWCILTSVVDQLESGAPTSIDAKERCRLLDLNQNAIDTGNLVGLSWYERGALECAGMTLSIFYAQYVGDGMGACDALGVAAHFDDACETFMRDCWEDGGTTVKDNIAAKSNADGGGYNIKDVLPPSYPDVDKHVKAFVDVLIADYPRHGGEQTIY